MAKDIKGYEGLYTIDENGSILNRFGKQLKPSLNNSGYLGVILSKNKTKRRFLVHRLVAIHFIDNPNNLELVNHIDENKTNNCVTNLEWCSRSYNINYGERNKNVRNVMLNKDTFSKVVGQFDLNGNLIKTYPSISECGRNGYSISCVGRCCNGERKTHKQYIWKFL